MMPASAVCPIVHLDGEGGMAEDLKGDPQQIQCACHFHADKQPVELTEQEIEAENCGCCPYNRSRTNAQRNLDAISARLHDRCSRGQEKARSRTHCRKKMYKADR